MATWDHINAQHIYPPELVKEVQKYYSGGYLWIPEPDHKKPRKESSCTSPKNTEKTKSR